MEAKLDYRVVWVALSRYMGSRYMGSRYHVKTRVQKHVVVLNTCSEPLNFRPELSAEEAKGGEGWKKSSPNPNPSPNLIA